MSLQSRVATLITAIGADIKALQDGKVAKTLYDANTILKADTDDTPVALTMGASTILARLAAGNIVAATPAQLRTLLTLVIGTDVAAFTHTHAESDVTNLTTDLAAKVAKTLYDANTVIKADTDDTPIALTMGASTILARLASGSIVAATPAELRTLLALVVGTNVQAWDADLDAIAALTSAADKMPYSTAAQTWALATLTTFGRSLIDDADAATARATLGVPALTDNKSLVTRPAIANTETVVLSYTCAANELAVGTTFLFKAYFTKAGTNSSSAVIRIRVGATTLIGNIAATLTPPANATTAPGVIEGLVTVVTAGSGGTIRGSLEQRLHLGAVTLTPAIASTAAVAVNTTTANILIELTFISGQSSNTYTFENVTLEKIVA